MAGMAVEVIGAWLAWQGKKRISRDELAMPTCMRVVVAYECGVSVQQCTLLCAVQLCTYL